MARSLNIWGRVPGIDEASARIDGVTRDAVRDFAERLAIGGRAALALYGPVKDAPELGELRERLAA
jgi:hypothetical protein